MVRLLQWGIAWVSLTMVALSPPDLPVCTLHTRRGFRLLIVMGAIGVFDQMPRGERLSTIPSTTGSSSRTAAANAVIGKGSFLAMTAQGPAQATVATPH